MWVALIKLTSFLGRGAAFTFAVCSLALISLTLAERDWMDGISIYIVVMGCVSILAALIPPFPNFLYDGFFAAAWGIAALFSFLILFLKSTCYGVANGDSSEAVACPKFKALVAMCFLEFAAWGGCAALGLLLFVIAIFKNARLRSNHNMVTPTIYREDHRAIEDRADSTAIPPVPAPFHVSVEERYGPEDEIIPFSDDKRPYPDEKRPYPDEKRPYPDEKRPFPAVYTGEERGEGSRTSKAVVPNTTYVEQQYAPKEPEYMRVNGLLGDFILAHWFLLGILGLIVAAIILPILIIYGIPAFAYYIANNLEIPNNFYGSITGFEHNYATFDIHSTIQIPKGITATLDPTEFIMFIPDTLPDPIPVAYIRTTKLKMKGGGTFTVYNQTLRVGNITEWGRLWRKYAFEPTMEIGVKGKTTIHTGPFKTSLELVKSKTFQGLLNATQLQFDYIKIQPPDEDGCNVVLQLPVVNPSPLTVNGDAGATADFLIGDTVAGQAIIDQFKLVKGKGSIKARARVDLQSITGIIQNFTQVIGTELPFLGRGMAVTTIQATSLTGGGHTWPYWVAAAKAIKLEAAVELQPIVGGLLGDMLGGILSGNGGSPLSLDPFAGTISINVTGINKILRNITILDAQTIVD